LCKKGENLQELYIAASSILGLDGALSPKRIDFHCEEFDGRHLFADSRGSLWRYPCAGVGLRASRKDAMTIIYGLAAVLALFLFGYLLYALLRAENF
jgi:K+-transporting ATPase KdpF subunit